MMNRFYFGVWIILVSACNPQATPDDKEIISDIWQQYYDVYTPMSEKTDLVTAEFKEEYLKRVNDALEMPETTLRQLSFTEKVNILTKRQQIQSKVTALNQLSTFEQAFKILEEQPSASITENGLKAILFVSDDEAFGIFFMSLSEKSAQFVKEGKQWKINPLKRHPGSLFRRDMFERNLIQTYGDEDAALEAIIPLLTDESPYWQPLTQTSSL